MIEELKLFRKFQKKSQGWGWLGVGGACEPNYFENANKKSRSGVDVGGCEPRIEVILKMPKKSEWGWVVRWGGGGGGGLDVNQELKLFETEKSCGGGWWRGFGGGGM